MLERTIDALAGGLATVAGLLLVVMLGLTVGDMLLGAVAAPFYGTFELIAFLNVMVISLSLATTQRRKAHVSVDLMMTRLGVRVQLLVEAVVTVLSLVLFIVLAWQMLRHALNLRVTGASSDTLRAPLWPVAMLLPVGAAGLALALLADLAQIVRSMRSSTPESIW